MKASRFSDEQIIGIVKQPPEGYPESGATVVHLCREHGMSEHRPAGTRLQEEQIW